MIETLSLLPGVVLRCCRDARFKQGCLSVQLVRPMAAQEAAMNALIPTVLLRGTVRHPDLRSITMALDDLYGAAVSPLVRRVGDYQTTGLYCSFMDQRFALPGDRVLEPMAAFLRELLLESPLEDGGFLREFVDSEKRNLISSMECELNDKQVYAMGRLLKTMCREDSFGLPRLGEKEQVAAIDAAGLYRHYQKILLESQIQLFYVGSAPAEQVAALLRPLFDLPGRNPQPLAPQTDLRIGPGGEVTETMEVTQGKLCMGFTTPITNRTPEFAAMQLLNTLFGGGMTSKLFLSVREKQSLCYSIGSNYYGSKGIVTVSAGIDCDKKDLVCDEILHQLELCRREDFTEQELNAAKQALISSLRATHDSPGSIEGYYATAALSALKLTPEEYMDAIDAVTASQVARAAQTLKKHTVYFLSEQA
ncbi:MAG: EF-P 5-aminopentanol modification-associated protein YfmF [Faecousia sp.]